MKVCMVAYSFYESDSRIIQYARALTRRGDSVDVIALSHNGNPRIEVVDGVTVYRIQRRRINEQSAFSYLCRTLRFLFSAMWTLTWKHLRERYDLVHVHSVPDFLVLAALPLRLVGVPVILDIHDILPEFYASKFKAGEHSIAYRALLIVEKLSAGLASHVIIANRLWYERLVNRSVLPGKCSVVGNYPNPELFHPSSTKKENARFLLMYPGSLNWHQGVDIAVRAFAAARAKLGPAEFQIFGEGPARPDLENLIRELGLEEQVQIRDYEPANKIGSIMGMADLAVVPKRASSKFGNEAASTKVQEFMAVRVPVIVSRTKIDTLSFDESMVRFFESDNVDALADAIVELYSHPDNRKSLVDNAARYIEKNNWDVRQYEYLRLVGSLVT